VLIYSAISKNKLFFQPLDSPKLNLKFSIFATSVEKVFENNLLREKLRVFCLVWSSDGIWGALYSLESGRML
jgi:hypothetical protein